ncbi:MAG TPA: CHASE3 domain-containing protein, partial [Nevskiaceae bacterium]|nr:CHASE3 domain-containing protein [Nevskiaceae bacterium]
MRLGLPTWVANLGLRQKMMLALGLMLAVIGTNGLSMLRTQQEVVVARATVDRTYRIIDATYQLSLSLLEQQGLLRGLILDPEAQAPTTLQQSLDHTERQLQRLRVDVQDADQRRRLEQIQLDYQDWRRQVLDRSLQLLLQQNAAAAAGSLAMQAGSLRQLDRLLHLLSEFQAAEQVLLAQRDEARHRLNARMYQLTLVMLAAAVLISLLTLYFMDRTVVRPLAELTELVPVIARAEGPLAIPYEERRDEIGGVSRALQDLLTRGLAQQDLDWIRRESAAILQALQPCDGHEVFGETLLAQLARTLGLGYALAYRVREQDGSLVYCAAYGLPDARARQQRFGRGEGLPGQCLLERRLLSLDPVP